MGIWGDFLEKNSRSILSTQGHHIKYQNFDFLKIILKKVTPDAPMKFAFCFSIRICDKNPFFNVEKNCINGGGRGDINFFQ